MCVKELLIAHEQLQVNPSEHELSVIGYLRSAHSTLIFNILLLMLLFIFLEMCTIKLINIILDN